MLNKDEKIIKAGKAINELVFEKIELQKAFNYYNGKMDPEQFRYLEENYGLSNPTSVEFIPLIKKHIDALVGEYIDVPIIPKITCKDTETLNNIEKDKHLKILQSYFDLIKTNLNNAVIALQQGQGVQNKSLEKELNKITKEIENSFISEYEIAAQNVLQYIIYSRETDMPMKLRTLLLDLLVTGYAFFKVRQSKAKNNIVIDVLDPLNTFIDRNPESVYVKNSYRAVIRKWLSKHEILNLYGHMMKKDAIKELEGVETVGYEFSSYMVRSYDNCGTGYPLTDGLEAGREISPGYPYDEAGYQIKNLIPVYEVEWVETHKKNGEYVTERHEVVRIGQNIYIIKDEEDMNVMRSVDNPTHCTLGINGLYYSNRGKPYSLVLACAGLQDKYNILHFYRDNIIANSGTIGDWLDLPMLPKVLGNDITERLQKFIAYKKQGIGLVDTSQDGIQFNNNTAFAGFDDTVKAQTIQGIELAIDRVENTCSSITGMFKERLDGISQYQAVSNVKTGARNSFIITKQYYLQMDILLSELLLDSLNIAKKVYKKGLKGTVILGSEKYQKIFTALPEHFTLTDYDINVTSSSEILQDIENIKLIVSELIQAQAIPAEVVIEAITCKSLTELKLKVKAALKEQEEKADVLGQLEQQVEQLQQELQQAQQMIQELTSKNEQLDEARLSLEQEKIKSASDVEWYKARADRAYKEGQIEVNRDKVGIELAQLHDGNKLNDKVKY